MGNSESTSRMIAMQRGEDGIIQVSERVMDHINNKSNHVYLSDDEQVIHKEDLKLLVEKTLKEGKRQEIEKYRAELEKWQQQLKETEDEKEKLRIHLIEDERQKVEEVEAKWKSILEDTNKDAHETLTAQLQSEQQAKIAELETFYQNQIQETTQKTIDELKESMTAQHEQQIKEIVEKEKEALRVEFLEKENTVALESLESIDLAEETNQKLKTLEDKWELTLQEEISKTQLEVRRELEEEQEAKLVEMKLNFLATFDEQLEEEKQRISAECLEKEKQVIDEIEKKWMAKMEEETEQALKAASETWQLALHDEGSKLADLIRSEVEGEQTKKIDELEVSCKEAYEQSLESEKEKIHTANLEKEQKLIEEIEANWMSKLEQKELEHAELIEKLKEVHQNVSNLTDAKLLEQEEVTSSLEKKVGALQFRQDDVQQQFDDSAEKVENQITPFKQNAVCVDARVLAMNCYKSYPTHPLRCSDEVQKFINCVQDERVKVLQRNAAS